MPRANRHYIPGYVWHTPFKWAPHLTGQVSHRCHKKEFLLKFARDRRRWLQWLFEASQPDPPLGLTCHDNQPNLTTLEVENEHHRNSGKFEKWGKYRDFIGLGLGGG